MLYGNVNCNFSIRFISYILAIFLYLVLSRAQTDDNNAVNDDNGEEGLGATVVLLFMFVGLSIGVIVMQILSTFGEVQYDSKCIFNAQ